MQIVARSLSEKISSRKVMLVADMIRNKSAEEALNILMLVSKRGAKSLYKVLKSAVANAVNNSKQDKKLLFVKTIDVTQGRFQKRFHYSGRGRTHPYKKRTSHIRIVLEEKASSH